MRNIKKLLSIVMVLTLVLALGAQAFAATVTIPATEDEVSHSYTAYQIFKGTQAAGDAAEKLASVQWGDGIDSTKFVNALKDIDKDVFGACTAEDPNTVVKALAAYGDDSDMAKKVAEAAADCLAGSGTPITAPETALDDGYYLIKDTTPEEDLDGNAAYNDVVLQATGSITVTFKADVPSSEKKVKDSDDTAGSTTEWQKSADWDIGDHVPFQITGKLPENYGNYDKYYLAFHDEQSDGLTFEPGTVKVYVDGTEITTGFEVKTTGLEADGCTFEVVFENMKDISAAKAGSVITVEYTAELNNNAVIGTPGNPNTSHMEFSNNPHGEEHGNTPDNTVVVFTYELDVDKVDNADKALAGAGFTLLKKVAKGGGTVELGVDPNKVSYDNVVVVDTEDKPVVGLNDKGEPAKDGEEIVSYTVDFKGLDDGDYILVESTVPAGYNKAADIAFTVSATHDAANGDGAKSLTGLNSSNTDIKVEGVDEGALTGHLSTKVVNNSGLELPETGGIGTTIFYVVGGVLVAAAIILLVTKRRVSGAK